MALQLQEVECSGEVYFKEHFFRNQIPGSGTVIPSYLPFFVSFVKRSFLELSIQPDSTQYIGVIIGIFHYIPEIPFLEEDIREIYE